MQQIKSGSQKTTVILLSGNNKLHLSLRVYYTTKRQICQGVILRIIVNKLCNIWMNDYQRIAAK
jgi:hypothetical protein